VQALAIHDDGSGAALYAGGLLRDLDPALANGVIRWDSEVWTRAGEPLDEFVAYVHALCSADLGDGEKLYAGGNFDGIDTALNNVAVWDGASWGPLGDGLPRPVNALSVIELEGEARLVAASEAGGDEQAQETIYVWDGGAWKGIGALANGSVRGVAGVPHEGDAVYIVGAFTEVGGVPSEGIARWGCMEACTADFNGDGEVDSRDFIVYLNVWAARDPAADLDGNGVVDSRDFIGFLDAWAAGC
jgi:hypothetical protein